MIHIFRLFIKCGHQFILIHIYQLPMKSGVQPDIGIQISVPVQSGKFPNFFMQNILFAFNDFAADMHECVVFYSFPDFKDILDIFCSISTHKDSFIGNNCRYPIRYQKPQCLPDR